MHLSLTDYKKHFGKVKRSISLSMLQGKYMQKQLLHVTKICIGIIQ